MCIVAAFRFTFVDYQLSHPPSVSLTGDDHTGVTELPLWCIRRYDVDEVQCHHSKLMSPSSNAEGLEVMLIKLYLVGSLLILGAMRRSLVALITCLPDIRRFWVVVGVLQARKLSFQNYTSNKFSCLDSCGDLVKSAQVSL